MSVRKAIARVMVFLVAGAISAAAQAASLVVSGSSEMPVVKDRALISVGVETRSKQPEKAQAENTATMKRLIESIASAGVDVKDMQTANFSIRRAADNVSERESPEPVYAVTNNLGIKVRDVAKIGDIVAVAVKNGANDIGDVQFYVSETRTYVDQVRKRAFDAARSEAIASAEAAGMRLGGIINITNGRAVLPLSRFQWGYEGADAPDPTQDLRPALLTGTVTIGYEVQVEYELLSP